MCTQKEGKEKQVMPPTGIELAISCIQVAHSSTWTMCPVVQKGFKSCLQLKACIFWMVRCLHVGMQSLL